MSKLPIPIKLVLTLVCGMISITMFSLQWFPADLLPGVETPTQETALTPTATIVQPFVNLSDLLLIDVEFYPEAQPQVLSVQPLVEGRLTPGGEGDVKLQVIGTDGIPVYDTIINPVFVYGEPAKRHDNVRMTLVIPNAGPGSIIRIFSADWTMEYVINGN